MRVEPMAPLITTPRNTTGAIIHYVSICNATCIYYRFSALYIKKKYFGPPKLGRSNSIELFAPPHRRP